MRDRRCTLPCLRTPSHDGATRPAARLALGLWLTAWISAGCSSWPVGAPEPVDPARTGGTGAELYVTNGIAAVSEDTTLGLYTLRRGRRIFSDEEFAWSVVPKQVRGSVALASELQRESPITTHFSQPGYLYAVLWRWDYGFHSHLPLEHQQSIDQWHVVDSKGARVRRAPEPFSDLPVYRMAVTAGVHDVPIRSYTGQWVITGFEPAPVRHSDASRAAPQVADAVTRHNIVRPAAPIRLLSPDEILSVDVYANGVLEFASAGGEFTAPSAPGRYALRVRQRGIAWTVPLTVGYPVPELPGWEQSFFPIHFYNGWGYVGAFQPNRAIRKDVETIAMFELGANTYFVTGTNELIDALGARQILSVRNRTRWLAREVDDLDAVRTRFRGILESLLPFESTTLGLYVEDEPPARTLEKLRIFEEEKAASAPGIELLYTVHGADRAAFWNTAGTTARMIRAYPIRKARRDDIVASVTAELADRLAVAQQQSASGRLWLVAQSFGDLGVPGLWDLPTPAEFRLMANLALARGTRGLTYFCFDSSPRAREWLVGLARWPFVPESDLYAEVKRMNSRIAALTPTITRLEWAGDVDQPDPRFDVQLLTAADGSRYVWITNLSTTEAVEGVVETGPHDRPIRVALDAGDGVLVPLEQ